MSETDDDYPEGWPGEVVLEGRTRANLPVTATNRSAVERERHGRGPASREHRSVFHNPAMTACRTRSVLLMAHVLKSGWLGPEDKPVRAIDALCASGIRARRWLNELPAELAARLEAHACDMDGKAIEWAEANHAEFPPEHGQGSLDFHCEDARVLLARSGWQWIDIDPFGAPTAFLDAAFQASARRAVMEITATDTAALTGSSRSACKRRYGAKIRCDGLAHDSGLRLLLATCAKIAAMHDRSIEPMLSSWDSHHLRISFRTRRSIVGANALSEKLGWRVANPTADELTAAVLSGLHPNGDAHPQPYCLLPLTYPVSSDDERISGPLWVGPLYDADVLQALNEDLAAELCSPSIEVDAALIEAAGASEREVKLSQRASKRAVRHLCEEATVATSPTVLIVDDLHQYASLLGPPSPARLVEKLRDAGCAAAIARYGNPSVRTDADWATIVTAAEAAESKPESKPNSRGESTADV